MQDSLFWISFIGAIAVAAAVIPSDGHAPGLIIAAASAYAVGLVLAATIGRGAQRQG